MTYEIITFITGLTGAFFWAKYIQTAASRQAWQSALWDMALCFTWIVGIQVWNISGWHFTVLLTYVIGSGIGTYGGVRYWGSPSESD